MDRTSLLCPSFGRVYGVELDQDGGGDPFGSLGSTQGLGFEANSRPVANAPARHIYRNLL